MTAPLDLASAEAALFRPHIGTVFTAGDHTLTLAEVTDRPDHGGRSTPPFSLVFKCETTVLPAAIYPLAHPELPPLELFLSPFEGGADWCQLEAIFN